MLPVPKKRGQGWYPAQKILNVYRERGGKRIGMRIERFAFTTVTRNTVIIRGWLVGCFEFNGPLRQYFSLYRAVSQREGERGEKG